MSKPIIGPKTLTPFVDELTTPQLLLAADDANNDMTYPCIRLSPHIIDIQLHSALPFCQIYGYNKQFPGPTIEVRRGQTIHVDWLDIPLNRSGSAVSTVNTPPTVRSNISTYTNNERATAISYQSDGHINTHADANHCAIGMWIIRDEQDDAILAALNKYELLLFIKDCDLAVDSDGYLTGQLAQNIANDTQHYQSPYTLVNGKIWPYTDIQARPYRLRLINGSHTQEFRLLLLDEQDNPRNDTILQIGNVQGRLDKPNSFTTSESLLLAPSSSLDILVDFSLLRGKHARFVNAAVASFTNILEFRVSSNESSKCFATLKLPLLNK